MNSKQFILIAALSALLVAGCVPTASILKADTRSVVTSKSLPLPGIVRTRLAGQPLITHVRLNTTYQRVAVMVNGFSQSASFGSSGYSIEIPVGAKGLLTGPSGACFHNQGFNAGLFRSKGTTNFCFDDTNRDGQFDKTKFDTINNWGSLDIAPARYVVKEEPVGYGSVDRKREIVFVGNGQQHPILIYREFVNNDLSKAIRQVDLVPDGGGDTVTFDGAKLKILSVDDKTIRYEVLGAFSGN